MKADMHFTTECHPEANGRKPEIGDVAWNVYMPLDDGNTLHIHMGKKGRDLLFGMLIADCQDSGEDEPNTIAQARKDGQEAMRERAAKYVSEEWQMPEVADTIRALPLEDKP